MKNAVGLALLLSVFWMINSGYFLTLLLSLGVGSIILTVWLMQRVDKNDHEHFPVVICSLRLPFYLLWLVKEIIKTNIEVLRYIWSPTCKISPTLVTVKASQKSEVARVLHANSITMTPGTVTLDINGDTFEVHALTKVGADELLAGEMDRRVQLLEKV